MLNIPDVLTVVKDWDKEVRAILPSHGHWFASVSHETGKIDPTITKARKHRSIRARKDLENWLKRVGLSYHSPHKFRQGNAIYSLKNTKDVSAIKVVSQNLMHKNLSISDGVYGILSDNDVRRKIATLCQMAPIKGASYIEELEDMTRQLLLKLGIETNK